MNPVMVQGMVKESGILDQSGIQGDGESDELFELLWPFYFDLNMVLDGLL